MHARRKSGSLVALAVVLIANGAEGQTIGQGDIQIGLTEVASGLTSPVYATHAGDGSGRLFVLDQVGQVRIVDAGGNLLPTPFLDVSGLTPAPNPTFDERGLLGLAFHPDYIDNGRFFVRYSAPRAGDPAEPCNDPGGFVVGCHSEVLSEFRVSQVDPNQADAASERVLFEVEQPQFNHNAGHVAFGPDGMLHFGLGDGGSAHDGLADVPISHGPTGHGQNKETTLGSLLRIDVDAAPQGGLAYAIPSDNPFVGLTGSDEIFAYGLRNPYRFSFDDGPGGSDDLILADVGQNRVEEIDVIVNGGNYGWVTKEGSTCFDPQNPGTAPASCSGTGPDGEPLLDPIAEYTQVSSGGTVQGRAIVGGFVYRGGAFAALQGKYVFGDFSTGFSTPDGNLFYLDADGDRSQILRFGLPGPLGAYLFGFGQDEEGNLFALTSESLGPAGATGRVLRIGVVPVPAAVWMGIVLMGGVAAWRAGRRFAARQNVTSLR